MLDQGRPTTIVSLYCWVALRSPASYWVSADWYVVFSADAAVGCMQWTCIVDLLWPGRNTDLGLQSLLVQIKLYQSGGDTFNVCPNLTKGSWMSHCAIDKNRQHILHGVVFF